MEKRREKKKKEFKLPENPNRYRIQVSLININNESFVFLLRNRNKYFKYSNRKPTSSPTSTYRDAFKI